MEETPPKSSNRNGDGNWRSRKILLSAGMFVLSFTVSTISLFIDKMTAEQWINFNEFLIPIILGLYGVMNVSEKKLPGGK